MWRNGKVKGTAWHKGTKRCKTGRRRAGYGSVAVWNSQSREDTETAGMAGGRDGIWTERRQLCMTDQPVLLFSPAARQQPGHPESGRKSVRQGAAGVAKAGLFLRYYAELCIRVQSKAAFPAKGADTGVFIWKLRSVKPITEFEKMSNILSNIFVSNPPYWFLTGPNRTV